MFNENSTNNGIANGFENAGYEVERYDYRQRAGEIGSQHRDSQIIKIAKTQIYDLIFFCKCNGMDVNVINWCNQYDTKTFLWYMDPLNGNYNDELIKKIKAADYVGVAKWEVYLKAKEINPNTHFLIEGFDPKWDFPIRSEKRYDISFIGNPYGDRQRWLDRVNATVLSDRYNIGHAKAVGQTKINLNFTGGGGPSDRAYKILAAGGFLLSQDYSHMDKYGLVPGKDFAMFNSESELLRKCEYYWSHDDERDKIAKHGFETVQKFSRDNLAKQIVDIVNRR